MLPAYLTLCTFTWRTASQWYACMHVNLQVVCQITFETSLQMMVLLANLQEN